MFVSITDYQMSRGEVCILLADFESPKMWHKMSFYQNYWNISPFVDHHCKKKEKYFHIKHKYFFFYPPPERVERPLELCLLELVFPVEDPGLLQSHGHGAQQQPVLAARESQPWAAEFWIELCSAPSVSQSDFTIMEKVPTHLLGPSPGWKRLLALSHLRHY